ncbi:MAG: hypothetical protein QXH55_03550 [Candidatus Korarchaeota archaeon]|nr:hypothetical protein [Thermoproteota archaeon]MCR8463305.1 hypothetical protein [Thermoproteota archaeon]MCR8471053.1 hypothetical protein [Thermoproteota archaeon]MCR8472214.1 hypothetical protein [Thermoproteota archaeon]MCR8473611.1 hypothetical protein [Thermoproteota archaeon]
MHKAISLLLLLFLLTYPPQMSSKPTLDTMETQGRGFSVRFEFKIPIVIINVSNETGYTNNMKDSIVARNVGNVSAYIEFKYKVTPPNPNITVEFSSNNFVLSPDDVVETFVNISVKPRTIAGKYSLSIIATAQSYPPAAQNPISYSQVYTLDIYVSGKAYSLRVITSQPDGASVYSEINVVQIFNGTENYIYRGYGYDITFFVVEGKYRIEAWFNGRKRAEETLYIAQNLTLVLQFSLIRIYDIKVISQPRSQQDNLIFKFAVANEDPLVYKRVVDIVAFVYQKNGPNYVVSSAHVATLTIRSTMTESLIGSVPAPNGTWKNDSYVLRLVAFCENVVMENVSVEIVITVITTGIIIERGYIPIIPLLAVALIAGLIGYLPARATTRRIKPVSRAPFRIKCVGVLGRGVLLGMHDFTKRKEFTMSEVDKIYPSLIALIRNMELLRPASWFSREHLPLAWSIVTEKFLIYPIDKEFAILLSTNAKVNERDLKVIRAVKTIAEFVRRLHAESELSYNYIMKHQLEYKVYLRRIAEFIRNMKLAAQG